MPLYIDKIKLIQCIKIILILFWYVRFKRSAFSHFDIVDLAELFQGEPGDLAFVCRMQVKEFAPGVRQAARFRNALRKPRFVPAAMWCYT